MPKQYPRAIVHVDGDSFFASCEQVLNPSLQGRPVVTGQERGIASAMSAEAKAYGITRGMPMHEVRRRCPSCIILSSNYKAYRLFATRMYDIVRRYTTTVEEYSIDECFADISGNTDASYEDTLAAIKQDLFDSLRLPFSVGLAPTKVLAKVASSMDKPNGCVAIPHSEIKQYLRTIPIENVWGIGPQTARTLHTYRLTTAYQFAQAPQARVERTFAKPQQEIWHELQGTSVLPVSTDSRTPQSITKTRTFTPPSRDKNFLLAQLSKNVEHACHRARQHGLKTNEVSFFLKTQQFQYLHYSFTLPRYIATPPDILTHIAENIDQCYRPQVSYRTTGVTLHNLRQGDIPNELFGHEKSARDAEELFSVIDTINKRHGSRSVFMGTSMQAMSPPQGHTRKQFNIPFAGEI